MLGKFPYWSIFRLSKIYWRVARCITQYKWHYRFTVCQVCISAVHLQNIKEGCTNTILAVSVNAWISIMKHKCMNSLCLVLPKILYLFFPFYEVLLSPLPADVWLSHCFSLHKVGKINIESFGKTNQYCLFLWFGVYLLALTSTKAYTLIIYILFSDTSAEWAYKAYDLSIRS